MSSNKITKILAIMALILLISTGNIDAHSGRTDSNGGHKDNKNASGLGSYHYHHGYGPHLHTNGCPYSSGNVSKPESVVSSSGGNDSSTSTDVEQQKKNKEELEKKEVSKRGYNDGYKYAYSGSAVDEYTGNYSSMYEESYEEGRLAGEEKLSEDSQEAYEKAYKLGADGELMMDNPYNNDILNSKYSEGYNKGKGEYVAKKNKEYSELGFEHGKSDLEKNIINIEAEFINIYEENYDKGQSELAKEYQQKGYYKSFESQRYIEPKFKNKKYINWYKEGYDKGIRELEELKNIAYNDGYDGKEGDVPEKFNHAKSIYTENYNIGKEAKSKENIQLGIGVTSVALIGVGGTYYYKSKKKNKNDEIDKFKKQ